MIKKILGLFLVFTVLSCETDYQPKPKGYFKIMPLEREMTTFNKEDLPFQFEYPNYYNFKRLSEGKFNLNSPYYNSTIHFTYKPIHADFEEQLTENIRLTLGHIKRADGLDEELIEDSENKKYAIIYDILGEVASPIQFVATDSISKIIRGSLYYNMVPNTDSLLPVHKELSIDVKHIVKSLKWKQ